ncbi:hypothetical protein Hanom_Chr13g01182571 [Helianthus anomalus]
MLHCIDYCKKIICLWIATGSISSLLCTSWSGDVGVDETGVEPNEIDLVMTQNGCQDQRSSRLFKGCKWCHCISKYLLKVVYVH